MGFRELIKKVQVESGFSDKESKDALECLVENIAVRLTEGERKDFASQLPQELEDIALSVYPPEEKPDDDLLMSFMELQDVEEDRAKKQMLSSWHALKNALTDGQIGDIKSQLPQKTVSMLL